MRREGKIDQFSGQKAAFPLSVNDTSDPDHLRAIRYLEEVREQARSLALNSISLKRKASQPIAATPSRRPAPLDSMLNYSDPDISFTEIVTLTDELFNGANKHKQLLTDNRFETSVDKITALYREAHSHFAVLEPQHPAGCTSLATWKAYTSQNWPIPLDHENTFRLFKYLVKWCTGQPPNLHFIWAWSLLLRTNETLSGDEISILRELSRVIVKHKTETPIPNAFVQVVGIVFRQHDLIM